VERKLYIGNLKVETTDQELIDFLNEQMKLEGLLEEPGEAATSAWVSSNGHYGFVEFRS